MNKIMSFFFDRDYRESRSAFHLFFPIVFALFMTPILWYHDRSLVMEYALFLLPLLFICFLIGSTIYTHYGDMKLFSAISCLTALGICLQLLIDYTYSPPTVFSPIKYLFSLLISIAIVGIYILFRNLL